jgi:hypothetical protein
MNFNYENTEVHRQMGGKIIRKVSINKGKGYKSVSKFRNGKKVFTVRKPIHKDHIKLIQSKKFIPGLFLDCTCNEKKKTNTRKNRK